MTDESTEHNKIIEATAMSGASSRRGRMPLQVIAIEVFSIVLGVFLALAVNQWREDRSRQQQADAALANIESEIRLNLELLDLIHDENMRVVEGLQAPDADLDTTTMNFTPGVQLRQTAWETAQSVGVFAHSDYDLIVDLAELYAMQNVYRTLAYQLTQSMMNGAAFASASGEEWDEGNVGPDFAPYLSLLVQTETALLKGYRERLKPESTPSQAGRSE